MLGSALNIKPILDLTGGRIEPLEKVRTRSKSIGRIVEIIAEHVGERKHVKLATMHANSQEDAIQLEAMARTKIDADESILTDLSPVVGTDVGPGTLALAFIAGA